MMINVKVKTTPFNQATLSANKLKPKAVVKTMFQKGFK